MYKFIKLLKKGGINHLERVEQAYLQLSVMIFASFELYSQVQVETISREKIHF
jgi:hypothetical protein